MNSLSGLTNEQIEEINKIELPHLDVLRTSKRDPNTGLYVLDNNGNKIVEFEIIYDFYNREIFYTTLKVFLEKARFNKKTVKNTIAIMRKCNGFYDYKKYRHALSNPENINEYGSDWLSYDTISNIFNGTQYNIINNNDEEIRTTFLNYFNSKDVKLNHEQLRELAGLTREEYIKRNFDKDYLFSLKKEIYDKQNLEREIRLMQARNALNNTAAELARQQDRSTTSTSVSQVGLTYSDRRYGPDTGPDTANEAMLSRPPPSTSTRPASSTRPESSEDGWNIQWGGGKRTKSKRNRQQKKRVSRRRQRRSKSRRSTSIRRRR
jgi:hypothetical protein